MPFVEPALSAESIVQWRLAQSLPLMLVLSHIEIHMFLSINQGVSAWPGSDSKKLSGKQSIHFLV